MKIEVFDPAMCCPTGVCGPSVDPALPRIAADLKWLEAQGVEVARYNLSQSPQAFIANAVVRHLLQERGPHCLPLVLRDGEVVGEGSYPTRIDFARWLGITPSARRPA